MTSPVTASIGTAVSSTGINPTASSQTHVDPVQSAQAAQNAVDKKLNKLEEKDKERSVQLKTKRPEASFANQRHKKKAGSAASEEEKEPDSSSLDIIA
ncbi:MAG: hypothetical protein D6719_05845 [Candidatus Dadabacteria bacterium]|nr:MAG: hypothetical protein D6719_05845 [Candidatus Dadabacteria bacterium]